MTNPLVPTISTDEAAARLKVTSRTIVNWIQEGRIKGAYKRNPDVAANSPYRVPVKEVERLERELEKERAK